jgi:hypothetical protein
MFKLNPGISEIAGIFAADGSMQKEHICFWGNITEDKDHYDKIIKSLFKKSFNVEVRPHSKKSNSVYGFYVCNKEIIKYFNEYLGFPFGSKTYSLEIPKKIVNSGNLKIWSSFIRGFCDSDGCLTFGKRYGTCRNILKTIHTYPRIQINSVSSKVIADLSLLLGRLNINHSVCQKKYRKPNESTVYLLQVCGKNNLESWVKTIGFNNSVHKTKYEIFKRFNFVPVNISLSKRKEILEGKINPWIYYPKWIRSSAWIERQINQK